MCMQSSKPIQGEQTMLYETEVEDLIERLNNIKFAIDYNTPLQNGKCFNNCFYATFFGIVSPKTWRYTEGVAIGHKGLLYYHAWLTSLQGKIWDITWNGCPSKNYFPRYIFDVDKLFDLAHDGCSRPFTRYIYRGYTNLKDAIIEEGVEHPDFDYRQSPTMGQTLIQQS